MSRNSRATKGPMLAMPKKSAFKTRAVAPIDHHEWIVLVLPRAERAANRLQCKKMLQNPETRHKQHLQSYTVFHIVCPKPCNTGVSRSHLLYPFTIRYFQQLKCVLVMIVSVQNLLIDGDSIAPRPWDYSLLVLGLSLCLLLCMQHLLLMLCLLLLLLLLLLPERSQVSEPSVL